MMASWSPCRDESAEKDCIDFMASDDVPSESPDICKTENPIITFDNLKCIDPSIPYPNTGYLDYVRDNYWCEPIGEAEEGDFEPKQKKRSTYRIPTAQMSTCTCLSLKETTSDHMDDVYVPLAKKALAYYNAKEHSNLSFVKVTVATYQCGPKSKVHMNFTATSEDGMEKLLFSELVDGSVLKLTTQHLDEFHVKGCCLLQEIESGNPIGWGCAMCGVEIIHPGPRHGYMIVGGDLFEGYPFWDYRISPWISKPTPDDNQGMYFACAMKALEYFNSTQFTNYFFDDLEVSAGSFTNPCAHKTIVHVNFKCFSPSPIIEKKLFFAELVVPTFATIDDGIWDIRKEPFIAVKGCCMLRLMHHGLPFGRACEVCYYSCNEVIHPGPKHGYHAAIGDDFTDCEFTRIGHGVY